MEENKSKVYILTDSENRIIRCEGGYTMSNISNIKEWIFIDEGYGDKYNLCQSHYFDGGLYTDDGICRYVWEGDSYRLRTDEEMEADRPEPTQPEADPNIAEIENLKKSVVATNRAIAETNKNLNTAVLELAAEKKKTAALAEELEAAKILLGVE